MTLSSYFVIAVEVYDPTSTPDSEVGQTSRQALRHYYLNGTLTTNKRLAQQFRPGFAQAALAAVAADSVFEALVRQTLVLPSIATVSVRLEETPLTLERT